MSVRSRFLLSSVVALALLGHSASAQKYRTAVGARLGVGNSGLTIQQRLAEKATLEGLALFREREVTGTLLLERHYHILGPSLNYYFGVGGHLGGHQDYGTVGGFDGIVGAEWKLPLVPFVVSFDFKPTLELNNDDRTRFPTALSLRYVLIKEKKRSFMGGLFESDKDRKRKNRKD